MERDAQIEARLSEAFSAIRQHHHQGKRAPHKPLLLLYALAAVQRGEERLIRFRDVVEPMIELLTDFGRPLKSGPSRTVHDPFWRLRHDDDGWFWEVPQAGEILRARKERTWADTRRRRDTSKHELIDVRAEGGFTEEVYEFLRRRPDVVNRLAGQLLEEHFTPTLREPILDAVAMPWVAQRTDTRMPRDPAFREKILRIYEGRCAICGYDGRLGRSVVGIEAAHIKWHSSMGADIPSNGIALCSLHHKAFDLGAVGIGEAWRLVVSQHYKESTGGGESGLLRFHGEPLPAPISGEADRPREDFVRWHEKEVFRKPARPL